MELTEFVDLADEKIGGAVIASNDEFFAERENLVRHAAPIFIEGKYTDRGKWMDGWETRRCRTPGFDWCVVRLGLPGIIRGFDVDTSFFRGNYPEHCLVEACVIESHNDLDEVAIADWFEVLPQSRLNGDSHNLFEVKNEQRVTHLRLKIFPDGGVARLRVYGEVVPDWTRNAGRGDVDLAAVVNGGRVIACSDMFFGHRHNLIMPGRALDMSDGWETKRRRGPGHDWCIIKLGATGSIHRIEVDTTHFKGNYPDSCSIEACDLGRSVGSMESLEDANWAEILGQTKLQAHTRHYFESELVRAGISTNVRFNIFPDGGVSRLRIFGTVGA